jgi:hypothetical protein
MFSFLKCNRFSERGGGRGEVGKNYQGAAVRRGARGPGPDCVGYVIVFLGSIRCNQVKICSVDGVCGQRPSCVRRCLLCFHSFLFACPPLLGARKIFFPPGPEPALGGPKRFRRRKNIGRRDV